MKPAVPTIISKHSNVQQLRQRANKGPLQLRPQEKGASQAQEGGQEASCWEFRAEAVWNVCFPTHAKYALSKAVLEYLVPDTGKLYHHKMRL